MIRARLDHTFTSPKAGNSPAENEDSFAFHNHICSLCDGASESIYAREWGSYLCRYLTENPVRKIDQALLSALSEPFQNKFAEKPGPWYVSSKYHSAGAASTLLLIEFRSFMNKIHLLAVGDSCAFLIQNLCLLHAFPRDNYRSFDNHPALIYSHTGLNTEITAPHTQQNQQLYLKPGTYHLLAVTDALAAWCLYQEEQGQPLWQTLMALETAQDWEAWLYQARVQGMKNDDSTLLVFSLEAEL